MAETLVNKYEELLKKREEAARNARATAGAAVSITAPEAPPAVSIDTPKPAEPIATPEPSPYEAQIRAREANQQNQVRTAATEATLRLAAQSRDAATAALDVQSARELGLDDGVVTRNRDQVRAQQKTNKYMQHLQGAPGTAAFVSDPTVAAVAQDDAEALTAFERGIQNLGAFKHGYYYVGEIGSTIISELVATIGRGISGLGEITETSNRALFMPFQKPLEMADEINQSVGRALFAPFQKALEMAGKKELSDAILSSDTIPWFLTPTGIMSDAMLSNDTIPWFLTPSGILRGAGEGIVGMAETIDPRVQYGRKGFDFDVAGGIGNVTAQITAALVNPGVGVALLLGQGAEQQAARLEAGGFDRDSYEADLAILAGAGVTGVTEKFQLGILLKYVPVEIRSRIVRIIASAGSEAAQEVVEGIGHNLIALGLYDPDTKLIRGLEHEAAVAGTVGAIVGAVIPGKGGSSSAVNKKRSVDAAVDALKDASITEGSPEMAALHRVMASTINSVQVPAPVILAWAKKQDGGSSAALASLGVNEQIGHALISGEPVTISGENVARVIFDVNNYPAFAEHIKYEGENFSVAELGNIPALVPDILATLTVEIDALKAVAEPTDQQQEHLTRLNRTAKAVEQFKTGEKVDLENALQRTPDDLLVELDRIVAQVLESQQSLDEVLIKGRAREIDKSLSKLELEIEAASTDLDARTEDGRPVTRAQANLDTLVAKREQLDQEQQDLLLRANTGRDVLATPPSPELVAENESLNQQLETLNAERDALVSRDPTLEEPANETEQEAAARDAVAAEGGDTIGLSPRQQLQAVDAEIATTTEALVANEAAFTPKPKPGLKEVTLKADRLSALGVRASRDAVRQVRSAFRAGVKLAKTDVKQSQTALITLLRGSGLKPKDVAKFVNTIRDIQTVEQLQRRLPSIQAKVMNLLEVERKAQIKTALKRLLKRTKTKKRTPLGKFTPEIAEVLDRFREAINMKAADAKAKLDARLGGLEALVNTTNPLDSSSAIENEILALVGKPEMVNSVDLENTLLGIGAIVARGRAINQGTRLIEKAKQDSLRDDLLEAIGPERDQKTGAAERGRQSLNTLNAKFLVGWSGSFRNKLHTVFRSSDAALVERVGDALRLFDETRAYNRGRLEMSGMWSTMLKKALGNVSDTRLHKIITRGEAEQVPVGGKGVKHLHSDGVSRTIVLSRGQLRMRVMILRNEKAREASMHPEGNAYTPEIIEALENELSQDDELIIVGQIAFYKKYYDRINEAHRRATGVNLIQEETYVPISRVNDDGTIDEYLKSALQLGSMTPGSLTDRTDSIRPLRDISDFETLPAHIIEVEYYIAYYDKVRLLTSLFYGKNSVVLRRIERNFGKDMAQTIRNDLEHFAKRGVQQSHIGSETIIKLMRNFSVSQLGLKPQITMKQFASFAALAEGVPSVDFAKGLVAFAKNPAKALRLLRKSELFATRGLATQDKDYADIAQATQGNRLVNFLGRNPAVTRVLMLNVTFGDKTAIAVGGYAHIYAKMKNGATEGQAIRSFELLTVDTQQSSDPDQQSELQRSNSAWARVMVQFMSSANAIARAEYMAITDFSRGRLTTKKFAKKMMLYHVVIPQLIMFMSNAFQWDNEDQGRALLMGSANGILIFGDVIDAAFSAALGQPHFSTSVRHILSFTDDFLAALKGLNEGDISWSDLMDGTKAIDKSLEVVGAVTGVGAKPALDVTRGVVKTLQGDIPEGLLRALGFSEYVLEKNDLLD